MSIYLGVNSCSADMIGSVLSEDNIVSIIRKYYSPSFGDIKYVMRPSVEIIDGNSPNFDGWVYADGSVRQVAQYPLARQHYGASVSQFSVANLYTFVQQDGHADKIEQLQSQAGGVQNHDHQYDTAIQYKNDFVLSAAFKIAVTGTDHSVLVNPTDHTTVKINSKNYDTQIANYYNKQNYIPGLHGAADRESSKDHRINVPLNIKVGSNFRVIDVNYAGSEHPECYPEHIKVFPFVYIGKKTTGG